MGFHNGRVLRVVLRAKRGNDQQVNVLHYDLVDATWPMHDNDPQTLADLFRDSVMTPFRAIYTNVWQIDPVYVVEEKDPQDPTAARSAWTSGSGGAGTLADPTSHLPRACTILASLKTDYVGKRYTGRMFLGGVLNEAEQEDGQWLSTTRYTTLMNAIPKEPDITSGVSSSTAKWCVYSRTARAAGDSPYTAAVKSYALSNSVHWLRSREA